MQIIFVLLLTKRYSDDQVTKGEMGGACGTYGEKRKTQIAIVNVGQLKGLLVRPRRRWEDNSKMNLMVRTGLMSLRIGKISRLHKRGGGAFLSS